MNFKDRILLEYNEIKKVSSLDNLVKSKDKTQIVKELFNIAVDKYSTVSFQRFDCEWGEFLDVEVDELKNKDKVKVMIIRKDNQDCGSLQVILLF